MPIYTDHNPEDFSFCWAPSTSRSTRVDQSERIVQSVSESSPLDSDADTLLCNLATLQNLNHERVATLFHA
jgi:hypothetical protein